MSLRRAVLAAQELSEQGDAVAVVKATATELNRPFYFERYNSAIPPAQILAIYVSGLRVR